MVCGHQAAGLILAVLAGACAAERGLHTSAAPEGAPEDGARRGAQVPLRVLSPIPPNEMYFRHYGTNPTVDTREESVSTFSVDVDAAAYALARAMLTAGQMPDEAAIRVEEFVNAFEYDYEAPVEAALSLWVEAFPSPYRPGYHVLLLGLRAREIARSERAPAHLVIVLDASASMGRDGRLETAKNALRLLFEGLDPRDSIALVSFKERAKTLLGPTSGAEHAVLLRALDGIEPGGAANIYAGLTRGYEIAAKMRSVPGTHRLILCSDGVADRGGRDAREILQRIGTEARRGIALSTVGVGLGHYDDVMLEQLANAGDGQYAYIDSADEAHRVFVRSLSETTSLVAKDAKVQVEFDPRVVSRFRLIGYENRHLETRAFHDDRADGGEIGAGGSMTALYEVKLQRHDQALGEVRVRHLDPQTGGVRHLARTLHPKHRPLRFEDASPAAQLAVAAAGFAEKLRGSYWARGLRYQRLLEQLEALPEPVKRRRSVLELGALIERARELDRRADKFEPEVPLASMSFDEVPILR